LAPIIRLKKNGTVEVMQASFAFCGFSAGGRIQAERPDYIRINILFLLEPSSILMGSVFSSRKSTIIIHKNKPE
jgi:hypothetical protein